ncbi:hypothetical protein PENTCL1PPCAC_26536, partial [Pristionchus entomophagus]
FKQDSKKLIWVFGISSCLTFFILTLSVINLLIGYRSLAAATCLVGSYLAAADFPMIASAELSMQYGCCGFVESLDWHKEKIFEWNSMLTDTKMTIQQNFSWVDQCADQMNKGPYDNYLCALPYFCTEGEDKIYSINISQYSRTDLSLLIHEESRIRDSFFEKDFSTKLHKGCISIIADKFEQLNPIFVVSTVIFVLVLLLQTFLIAITFVNDNAIGRLVKNDGVPSFEKLEKCGPLAFFKNFDRKMGVQKKNHQEKDNISSEEE